MSRITPTVCAYVHVFACMIWLVSALQFHQAQTGKSAHLSEPFARSPVAPSTTGNRSLTLTITLTLTLTLALALALAYLLYT